MGSVNDLNGQFQYFPLAVFCGYDLVSGDDRFGAEGGLQRTLMLETEMERYPSATLANVLAAENAAASEDVRAVTFWPTLKQMLGETDSPSARATQLASLLDAWHDAGGSRVDKNLDGNVDDPGAAILDAAWQGITDAGICGGISKAGCKLLEKRISRYEPQGQYSGWHQYMDKDFRTLLGKPVKGKYALRYCGNGVRKACATEMWKAIDAAGKTLATFDFDSVPMVSKAQVMALASGDEWLAKGANILLFGPPGGGKSHLSSALGLALIENGQRVFFARTTDLVQRLQLARRELGLESAIAKLDRYDLLILDDLAYVTKDQAETSVLFELIAARYERRSMLITANQPFGEWGKIFPDPAMTLAAVDRLVHYATIFEMNVESYRRRTAIDRKQHGPGRPAHYATSKNVAPVSPRDNQPHP